MEPVPSTPSKPEWLEKLELDSWQAELIVSGVATYGALQLPAIIQEGVNYVLTNAGESYLPIWYLITWYLLLASGALIISFIGHFILRCLWVGMVGLASVFPNGISTESSMYSRHFLEQVKRDFPDLRKFNADLDQWCSLVFAIAFAFVMVMVAFCMIFLLALGLTALIVKSMPGLKPEHIFYGLTLLILAPSLLSGILNIKSLRDKPWVQKVQYPILGRITTMAIFHIFHRPVTYINFTLWTNINRNKMSAGFGVAMLLSIAVGMIMLFNSNAYLLIGGIYVNSGNRSDQVLAGHYADQLGEYGSVLYPHIPSDIISGKVLRVFVPVHGRDEAALPVLCGEYQENDTLSDDENRKRRRAFRLDCLQSYLRFELNGQKVDTPAFYNRDHPNTNQDGVMAYIPLDSLPSGPQELRIIYENKLPDGKKRENVIPFWYEEE